MQIRIRVLLENNLKNSINGFRIWCSSNNYRSLVPSFLPTLLLGRIVPPLLWIQASNTTTKRQIQEETELMLSSSSHTGSKREDGWKERRHNNDLLCLRHHFNLQNVKLQTPIRQQTTVTKFWWLCTLFVQWRQVHMHWKSRKRRALTKALQEQYEMIREAKLSNGD